MNDIQTGPSASPAPDDPAEVLSALETELADLLSLARDGRAGALLPRVERIGRLMARLDCRRLSPAHSERIRTIAGLHRKLSLALAERLAETRRAIGSHGRGRKALRAYSGR